MFRDINSLLLFLLLCCSFLLETNDSNDVNQPTRCSCFVLLLLFFLLFHEQGFNVHNHHIFCLSLRILLDLHKNDPDMSKLINASFINRYSYRQIGNANIRKTDHLRRDPKHMVLKRDSSITTSNYRNGGKAQDSSVSVSAFVIACRDGRSPVWCLVVVLRVQDSQDTQEQIDDIQVQRNRRRNFLLNMIMAHN